MTSGLEPTYLTCEYLENPRGVTVTTPRLGWIVASDERGQAQTGYQVLVAENEEALAAHQGTLWDSGRVPSDQTTQIAYQGRPLKSSRVCYWKVRVWDKDGEVSAYSEPALWQMGLLDFEDWQAQWIGIDPEPVIEAPAEAVVDKDPDLQLHPGVYLRRAFTLDQPVTRATLHATAKGVYIPSLNGERVGEAELAPGWTDYDTRVQVQSYDVTDQVRTGENVIGVTLGDGWYSGYLGFGSISCYYGDHPRALLQLELTHPDGTTTTIVTDERWQASLGPIIYSDIQMGERYDARREVPGWDDATGSERATQGWVPAKAEPLDPSIKLEGQRSQSIRVTGEVKPTDIRQLDDDTYLVDMGQNMVGRVRLRVSGPEGTIIRLRHGEILERSGELHVANLRRARATDIYVLKGDREEVFEPHFTYHGFRYVEVQGYPGDLTLDAITGRVMHNDMPETGTFECSSAMINQLWQNIFWGQRGNFVTIPTDCPQRDERLGWSGDAQIFARTASFNMDVAGFFTKWMNDYADAQTAEGAFTDIAPQIKGMNVGAPGWGDAGIIIPWTLYRVYGDTRLIERHYAAMQRWMNYIADVNPFYLRTKRLNNNYSDWVALERGSSGEQIATAYWAKIARMMAEMAEAIGRHADADHYTALYEAIRQAYVAAYVHPDGRIETNTQTAYVMALDNDLLPENLRDAGARYLVKALERNKGHLATGFLGTPPLTFVLTETGHLDTAYQLLNQETYPSWGYMIKNGATTMWERWNAYTEEQGIHDPGMNSFNHYAYGAIAEWLYRVVAGIDTQAPGYKEIRLRPRPGGGLDYVKASYRSVHGTIESAWRREADGIHFEVTVPTNTVATLELPAENLASIREDGEATADADGVDFVKYEQGVAFFKLASGRYHFVVDGPDA